MGRTHCAKPALAVLTLLTLTAAAAPPIVPRAVALAAHGVARAISHDGTVLQLAVAVSDTEWVTFSADDAPQLPDALLLPDGDHLAVLDRRNDEDLKVALFVTPPHGQPIAMLASGDRPLSGRRLYAPLVRGARWAWSIGWMWSEEEHWLRTDHDPARLYPGTPLFTADGRLVGLAQFGTEPGEPLSEEDGILFVGPTGAMTWSINADGLRAALARLRAATGQSALGTNPSSTGGLRRTTAIRARRRWTTPCAACRRCTAGIVRTTTATCCRGRKCRRACRAG